MGRSDACGSLLGTSFASRRWLSLDPCGLCCVFFAFAIHIFALVVIPTRLLSYSAAAHAVFLGLYCPAAALALSSLFVAWTTDPGAVPMGARPLPVSTAKSGGVGDENGDEEAPPPPPPAARRRGIRRCRKCNDNYKPPRAHHDSVTGRCIVKMDHFCPWVGNVVGALNHKHFFLFILYTMIAAILSLILLLMRFVRCGYTVEGGGDRGGGGGAGNGTSPEEESAAADAAADGGAADDGEADPTLRLLRRSLDEAGDDDDDGSAAVTFKYPGCEELFTHPILILFVVSVAFLFFTCCMLTEQVDAISSNMGKIARKKTRAGAAETEELGRVATDFNEMFGGGPCGGNNNGSGGGGGGGGSGPAWHWFVPLPVRFPDGMHDAVMGYEYDPKWGALPYREPEDGPLLADGGGTIVAGGAAPPSSSALAAAPPPKEPPLAPSPPDGGADEFVQEAAGAAGSEGGGGAGGKAAATTTARKRNKQERTVPSIV